MIAIGVIEIEYNRPQVVVRIDDSQNLRPGVLRHARSDQRVNEANLPFQREPPLPLLVPAPIVVLIMIDVMLVHSNAVGATTESAFWIEASRRQRR
jgi:hypothetical protein